MTEETHINRCHIGDCRTVMRELIAEGVKVQTVITSPPYWGLRAYGGGPRELGLERTPQLWKLLEDDGTVWLNMGDSYYSPRVGGGVGNNSTINGQRTQAAFRDAQRARNSTVQHSNMASTRGGINRQRAAGKKLRLKPKDMVGMPWMLALLLRADGWTLRQDIIYSKKNPMPESTKDRCTKAHEYLFLLSKSERYYFDQEAIKEPASTNAHARRPQVAGWAGEGPHTAVEHNRPKGGPRKLAAAGSGIIKNNESYEEAMSGMRETRNKRSVWPITSEPFKEAHFATFPRALVEPCILAGSRPGDVVFDPFLGSGTVAQVAESLGRQWLGIELQGDYLPLQAKRLRQAAMLL